MDWEHPQHPLAVKEPRHGRRLTLAATVHCPAGPLQVYSAHLEVGESPVHVWAPVVFTKMSCTPAP